MDDEQWWALWLTVPAVVVSAPFYLASLTSYWWCRRGFAEFLAFVEAFEGLPQTDPEPT